jgi:hypothetical protein
VGGELSTIRRRFVVVVGCPITRISEAEERAGGTTMGSCVVQEGKAVEDGESEWWWPLLQHLLSSTISEPRKMAFIYMYMHALLSYS